MLELFPRIASSAEPRPGVNSENHKTLSIAPGATIPHPRCNTATIHQHNYNNKIHTDQPRTRLNLNLNKSNPPSHKTNPDPDPNPNSPRIYNPFPPALQPTSKHRHPRRQRLQIQTCTSPPGSYISGTHAEPLAARHDGHSKPLNLDPSSSTTDSFPAQNAPLFEWRSGAATQVGEAIDVQEDRGRQE